MSSHDDIFRPEDTQEQIKIKNNRRFPTSRVILLSVLVAIQVGFVLLAILYKPKPQDVINEYNLTVTPLADGSLDISYDILWTPLDKNEPLAYVTVGMANDHYTVYENSLGSFVSSVNKYSDDYGYTYLELYLDREYNAGDQVAISFKINQRRLLSQNDDGTYYHRFVPGWFNAVAVESFRMEWKDTYVKPISYNSETNSGLWQTSLDNGEYVEAVVNYDSSAFKGVNTVVDFEFDDSGAYDELSENKMGIVAMSVFVAVIIFIADIYIVDCVISYYRGRGFIRGYGHHVHYYGVYNPVYIRARNRHVKTSGGGRGFGGGGCACACACACAGGGRAGCSQKDGYTLQRMERGDDSCH